LDPVLSGACVARDRVATLSLAFRLVPGREGFGFSVVLVLAADLARFLGARAEDHLSPSCDAHALHLEQAHHAQQHLDHAEQHLALRVAQRRTLHDPLGLGQIELGELGVGRLAPASHDSRSRKSRTNG
jgi:hypothetical protein